MAELMEVAQRSLMSWWGRFH